MPRVPNTSELEDRPHEDRKSVIFSSDEELMPKHPSILKINPSLQEVKLRRLPINPERIRRRNLGVSPTE
ncbi:rCG22358 [Rattus norvegicus]|nr:rCG22358 [Rattus norvegicus]